MLHRTIAGHAAPKMGICGFEVRGLQRLLASENESGAVGLTGGQERTNYTDLPKTQCIRLLFMH